MELKNKLNTAENTSVFSSETGFFEFDLISLSLRKALELEREYLEKKKKEIDYEWIGALISLVRKLFGLENENIEKSYEEVKKINNLDANGEDKYGFSYIKINKIKDELNKFCVTTDTGDSMLNSFFIEDLNRVKKGLSKGKLGKALEAYLKGFAGERIDVRTDKGLDYALEILNPIYFPKGCWPSEPDKAPSFSQQLAINEIWNRLAIDDQGEGGIFSINGPPGTGKTTLLRDLISAIIVERAKYLCENNPFKENECLQYGKDRHAYKLDEKIKDFIIIVASSNNTAVENVSLELPKKDAIGKSFTKEAENVDYFKEAISKYLEEKLKSSEDEEKEIDEGIEPIQTKTQGWGLVAVALGKSENREKFKKTDLSEIREELSKANIEYQDIKEEFLTQLKNGKRSKKRNCRV
ncbi:MAG: hypothetical protein NZ530_08000 [Thermodesulfobacteriaceae bacterium]|nr:hypothetical protein [Thermodesulfobacteriaceae bacterium]MDW7998974.1 AAA domain-containing protein [Thermodesulfovibrio sp.]